MQECKKYPPNKKFRWELRGEVDLMALLNAMAPMLCRPFIVPGNDPPVQGHDHRARHDDRARGLPHVPRRRSRRWA